MIQTCNMYIVLLDMANILFLGGWLATHLTQPHNVVNRLCGHKSGWVVLFPVRFLRSSNTELTARMYNHAAGREEWQWLSILYPDDLAEAIYAQGEDIFRKCMFGDVDATKFWSHCATHCDWFKNHSMFSYECKDKLIPLSLYGDDVNTYRNSDIGAVSIIAWTSDFGYLNKSCLRYWPICVYSEHCSTDTLLFLMCSFCYVAFVFVTYAAYAGGVFECFCYGHVTSQPKENTHEDIMRCLTDRLKAMCSKEHLFGWSDKGYCYMFSSLQGDLKWVHEKYGLHNFRANACCSTCGALKTADDLSMTIADFRPGASHVGTEPNLDEFYAMDPCIFELATRDRVLHDCMHSQLLGTGKVCNGSALIYLAESGYWGAFPTGRGAGKYDDCLETCLRAAHRDFIFWKKVRKIQTSQSRFTPARCGRKNRQQYPALNNKAAASKACTMWLAERTCEFAARADATEQDQLVCTTVHSYALALLLMDETELLMSEERATRFYNLMMRHLQTHALLNKRSRLLVGKAVGRNMWLIMPKHHHLFHAAHRVLTERVNPRAWALFAGEDFVGRVARIARVCHRLTVSQRTLQRYLALVYLELQNLKS